MKPASPSSSSRSAQCAGPERADLRVDGFRRPEQLHGLVDQVRPEVQQDAAPIDSANRIISADELTNSAATLMSLSRSALLRCASMWAPVNRSTGPPKNSLGRG